MIAFYVATDGPTSLLCLEKWKLCSIPSAIFVTQIIIVGGEGWQHRSGLEDETSMLAYEWMVRMHSSRK
jgi:hypothetical protein